VPFSSGEQELIGLDERGDRSIIGFVGIGSNLGDPLANCVDAINRVDSSRGIRVVRRSSFYHTEPFGNREQDWFVNAVVEIRTILTPGELLHTLQSVETAMGRVRGGEKWAPRSIDLDILFYGQHLVNDPGLAIPHPELHKRRFVLIPLNEIAPYVIHPAFGVSIKGLLSRIRDESLVKIISEESSQTFGTL